MHASLPRWVSWHSARSGVKSEQLFTYDAEAQTLTRKSNPSQVLKVFDAVRVSISVETLRNRTQKLVYRLVKPFEAPVPDASSAVARTAAPSTPGDAGEKSASAHTKAKPGRATGKRAAPSTPGGDAATPGTASAKAKKTKRRRKKR